MKSMVGVIIILAVLLVIGPAATMMGGMAWSGLTGFLVQNNSPAEDLSESTEG